MLSRAKNYQSQLGKNNKTNTKNNNGSITVSFRQPFTISQYSAVYCFYNLYVLDYFVRLLIFRQGIVYERTLLVLVRGIG